MAAIPEVSVIKNISDEVISSEHKIIFAQASCKVKQATLKKFYSNYSRLLRENKELAVEIAKAKKRNDKLRASLKSSYTLYAAMDDNNVYLKKAVKEKEHENKQLQNKSDSAVKHFQNKWMEYHIMYESTPLALQRKEMKTSLLVSEFNLMKSKMDEQYLNRAINRLKNIQNKKMQHLIIDFSRNMVKYNENIKTISRLRNEIKNCEKNIMNLESEKNKILHYVTNRHGAEYKCKRSSKPDNILSEQELFGGALSSNLPLLSFAGSLNIPVLQFPQDQKNAVIVEQENLLKNTDVSHVSSNVFEYAYVKQNLDDMHNKKIYKEQPHSQKIICHTENKTDNDIINEVQDETDQQEKYKNQKIKRPFISINDKERPIQVIAGNNSTVSIENMNISPSDRAQKKVTVLEDIVLNPDETTGLIRKFHKKDTEQPLPEKKVVDSLNLSLVNERISDSEQFEKNQQKVCELTQHQRDYVNSTDDLHEKFRAEYHMNKSPVFVYAPNKNLPTRKEDNINGQSIFFSKNETAVTSQNEPSKDVKGSIEYNYLGSRTLAPTKSDMEHKEVASSADVNTSVENIDTDTKNVKGEKNQNMVAFSVKKGVEKDSPVINETSQELRSDINYNMNVMNENNNMSLNENLHLQQNVVTQNNSYYPSSCFSLNDMMPTFGSSLDSEYGDDSLQDYSGLIDPAKRFSAQTTVEEPAILLNDAQPVESSGVIQKENNSTFRFGVGAFSSNPFKMLADNNKQNDSEEKEKPDTTLKFLFNRGETSKKSSFFNFSK